MFFYTGHTTVLTIFNMLGRLVLPIFLFMCAEGFHYTKDRKKYAQRLFIAGIIMYLGNWALDSILDMEAKADVTLFNGIFMTMFVSVVAMYGVDCLRNKKWAKGIGILLLPLLTFGILMFVTTVEMPLFLIRILVMIPSYFTVESGILGVVLAVGFYIFRENRKYQYLLLAVCALLSTGFRFDNLFTTNYQWMMVFSILLLAQYNGQRGKGSKYLFYLFYPIHIWLLYILSYFYYKGTH